MKSLIKQLKSMVSIEWGSCIDLISLSTGEMKNRYGFVYVNQDQDYRRLKKASLHLIQTNGEEIQ